MPNTPDTVVTPCPFCQHRPGAYETRAVELFYRHDTTGCILDDLRIAPEAIDKWNTRMNQALDTADLQRNEQSVESGSASSTGVETDTADEGMAIAIAYAEGWQTGAGIWSASQLKADWDNSATKAAIEVTGVSTLLARVERLREALEQIVDHDGVSYRYGDEVREIARKAIEVSLP